MVNVLGENLKRLRAWRGLSLRKVGEGVGLSHTQIANYEEGKDYPGSAALVRLAKFFDVRPEFFVKQHSDADITLVHVIVNPKVKKR